jgi:protein arginine N-methyltransferase 5
VTIAAGRVVVVAADMRDSRSKIVVAADILVSELLGSWGDNELSPECIQGAIAQGYLKADTGRCIPSSYTSYLSPVIAAPQWMRARGMLPPSLSAAPGVMCGSPGLETPYVCYLHDYLPVGGEEPVFTFKHRSPPAPLSAQSLEDNTSTGTSTGTGTGTSTSTLAYFKRRSCVAWTIDAACTIHGFEGTFDAVLSAACGTTGGSGGAGGSRGSGTYDQQSLHVTPADECASHDVRSASSAASESYTSTEVPLSITRAGRTPGMYSWFSLFLPLSAPVQCEAGSRVEAVVWRCTDGRRVWYEWCLISPLMTPIQNPNGRTYSIGL